MPGHKKIIKIRWDRNELVVNRQNMKNWKIILSETNVQLSMQEVGSKLSSSICKYQYHLRGRSKPTSTDKGGS